MRDLAVGYYAYNTLDSLARDDTDIICSHCAIEKYAGARESIKKIIYI